MTWIKNGNDIHLRASIAESNIISSKITASESGYTLRSFHN